MLNQQEIEFQELINRNRGAVNKVCLLFSKGDKACFQDMRQEVYCRLWDEFRRYGLSRFRHECAESTWIFQFAVHVLCNYCRKQDKNPAFVPFDTHETKAIAARDDQFTLLDEMLERLGDRDRRYVMYYLEGLTYNEIAESEHITVPLARLQMSRLIKKLKQMAKQDKNETERI